MPNSTLLGHTRQRQRLGALVRADSLPQALMFAGPAGIGKFTLAKMLATALLCASRNTSAESGGNSSSKFDGADSPLEQGCGTCQSCRLIEHGNHPDFHVIQALSRENSSVSEIRELLQNISLRPFIGSKRIVIINDAEHLSVQVSNVLLKSLEEPRPNTYFILISANQFRLPKTLLSRCQTWFFDNISDADLRQILAAKIAAKEIPAELSRVDLDDLVVIADGSLERISEISADLDYWRELSEHIAALEESDISAISKHLGDLSKDRESLRRRLGLLRIFARQKMLRSQSGKDQLPWAKLLANLLIAERLIFERNISAGYVLTASVLDFYDDSRAFTLPSSSAKLIDTFVV